MIKQASSFQRGFFIKAMNIMNQKHFVTNNVCDVVVVIIIHISLAIFYFQSDFILFVNIIMHWLIHKANLNADKNVFRSCMYVRKEFYRNHRKIRSITTTTNNSIHENFTMNRFAFVCLCLTNHWGGVYVFESYETLTSSSFPFICSHLYPMDVCMDEKQMGWSETERWSERVSMSLYVMLGVCYPQQTIY